MNKITGILGEEPEVAKSRIVSGKAPICVVGIGHVGLPLALLLVEQGAKVFGCDNNEEYLDQLRAGRSTIVEHSQNLFSSAEVLPATCPTCGVRILKAGSETFCPSCMRRVVLGSGTVRLTTTLHGARARRGASKEVQDLLRRALKSGRLVLTSNTGESVRQSRVVIITVGTPIDEHKRPDPQALIQASKAVGKGLKKGDLVVVRSTVSPGTTEGLIGSILTEESGLLPVTDFGLAHAPETTIEGLALFELRTLSKLIGGTDLRSSRAAAALFSVFGTPTYIFDSPRTTETAKLFLNIYRDVNIALVNELAQACEALGVDVMKVIEATHADPKTNFLIPGPGVGGFCLPKDSYYLTSPASRNGFVPRLLTTARQVNDLMPTHVATLARDALEEAGQPLQGSRIAVLGIAFKGNTADTRESPSLSVIGELMKAGATVVVHDPLVPEDDARVRKLGTRRETSVRDAVAGVSAVLLLTDHLEYRGLSGANLRRMDRKLAAIVDARHVLDPDEVRSAGLVYRGVGRGYLKRD
jgi:UDP-N-acetyl-D-mannosaminuronic acid dehydrogenase